MDYGLLCKPMVVRGYVTPNICKVVAYQCKENKCTMELAEAPPVKAVPICEEKKAD